MRAVEPGAHRQHDALRQPSLRRTRAAGEERGPSQSQEEPCSAERRATPTGPFVPAPRELLCLDEASRLQQRLELVHDVDAGVGDDGWIVEPGVGNVRLVDEASARSQRPSR